METISFKEWQQISLEKYNVAIPPTTIVMYLDHVDGSYSDLYFSERKIPADLDPREVDRKVDEYLDNRKFARC
jgi:hypothetical protein